MQSNEETKALEQTQLADEVLTKALQTRKNMIEALAPDGKVSDDPKKLRLLNEVLNGTEATAIGIKRLKVDEDAVGNDKQTASMLLQFLLSKQIPEEEISEIPLYEAPVMSSIQDVKIASGELVQGTSVVDYDTLMGNVTTNQ